MGVRVSAAARYAGALTYPPKPTSTSAFLTILMDESTEAIRSSGTRSQDGDGVLLIRTRGIVKSSNPAAGTRLISNPLFVPMKMHVSPGWSFIHSRATARAGSICPAVPPPARTTVAI